MLLRTCGAEVITEYEALVERVRDILTIEQSVLITGFSGAGKSHLAERLGSDLGVSMVHLDEYATVRREQVSRSGSSTLVRYQKREYTRGQRTT